MDFIGNQKAIALLDKIFIKGIRSNAYIFTGPEGVGKFTAALDFAKKLAGNKKINPDLIIIEPETEEKKGVIKKLDIKIEKIRELQHQLSLSPEGRYKVAVINDAESLNKSAQNALLKTLEEPDERSILILVTKDDKKLLTTIASRCQKIKFSLVADPEMEKIIPDSVKDKKYLLFWSLGRPGNLINLLNNKEDLEFLDKSARELKKLFSMNVAEKFFYAEEITKDAELLAKKMDCWTVILRRSMLAEEGSAAVPEEKALSLIDHISSSLRLIRDTNSNAKLVVENLFLNF